MSCKVKKDVKIPFNLSLRKLNFISPLLVALQRNCVLILLQLPRNFIS